MGPSVRSRMVHEPLAAVTGTWTTWLVRVLMVLPRVSVTLPVRVPFASSVPP